MHIVLVAIHVFLLVAFYHRLERGIVRTDPEEIARLSLIKTVTSQGFAIVRLLAAFPSGW